MYMCTFETERVMKCMYYNMYMYICENVECSLQIIYSWAERKADTLSPQHSVHCTWWLSCHCAFHHCVGLWAGWGQVPCSVDGSGGQPPRGVPHSHLPVLPGQRSTLWQCVWNQAHYPPQGYQQQPYNYVSMYIYTCIKLYIHVCINNSCARVMHYPCLDHSCHEF